MELMDSIDTKEIKENLYNLKEVMPGEDQFVYDFAKVLSDRLNPRLAPIGLKMSIELLLTDLHNGVNSFSEPSINRLLGYPDIMYNAISGLIVPKIVEKVVPQDFYEAYNVFCGKVEEEMKKSKE
ncbi:hypothetical protein ACFL1H_02030 [Nanoarchaeota archaeon]